MSTSGNFTRRLLSCGQVGGIDKSSKSCRDTFGSVKKRLVDTVSHLLFACFCRVFSDTYENALRLCDLFRFLTASTDFLLPPVSPLPLPSCLPASYLPQLPCRPSPQLCSVISCTFQMFYPHYSICLTPQPLHFFSSPTPPNSNHGRSCFNLYGEHSRVIELLCSRTLFAYMLLHQ